MPPRFRRAIVIVCDGLGVGEAPDAAAFGDEGSDTLGHVLASRSVLIPNLAALGMGNLTPSFAGAREARTRGAYGKMAEKSAGKDTATGHWEMTGLVTPTPFRTFPQGFPPEVIEPFTRAVGRGVLGNKAASGTEILKELGEEHLRTGSLIVYTSGDSVFQIAAHEDLVPLEDLYRICRVAYEIACLQFGVCRVIARPFVGRTAADFKRTPNRRDFPVPPGGETLLDALARAGHPVFGVGKIEDIFTGRGITGAVHTTSDSDGVDQTLGRCGRSIAASSSPTWSTSIRSTATATTSRATPGTWSCWTPGCPRSWARWMPGMSSCSRPTTAAIPPTCPPTTRGSTYPCWSRGPSVRPGTDLGVRESFADMGQTLADNFGLAALAAGRSFLGSL